MNVSHYCGRPFVLVFDSLMIVFQAEFISPDGSTHRHWGTDSNMGLIYPSSGLFYWNNQLFRNLTPWSVFKNSLDLCFSWFLEVVWKQVSPLKICPGRRLALSDLLLVLASLVCWQAHLDTAPASVTGHGRVTGSTKRRVPVYFQVTLNSTRTNKTLFLSCGANFFGVLDRFF